MRQNVGGSCLRDKKESLLRDMEDEPCQRQALCGELKGTQN